jgi:hypothetical protein
MRLDRWSVGPDCQLPSPLQCLIRGELLSKPIKKLAVQLQSNKGTFIIQLGTCHGFTKGKTSNLRLQGEDATTRRQGNK